VPNRRGPVLLATGGTGGHIFPAVALAQALAERGLPCEMIGARGGMEEGAAARAGLPFHGVRAGKLDRSRPDPRALLRAAAGFLDANSVIAKVRPTAVVGFGGFASLPGAIAAGLRAIPLVLHEANAQPGLVTRLLARRAHTVALAHEATAARLPGARTRWVGMPVREVRRPREEALAALGLERDRLVLLVIPGSQGSVLLNRLLPPLLERTHPNGLVHGRAIQVLHVTGPGRLAEVQPRVRHLSWYLCAESVDGPTAWSAATLAIARAGFGTIADAAFHGVPLIMVPLPSAAEDHQTRNAEAVQSDGAGLLIRQSDLEREAGQEAQGSLAAGILACLEEERRAQMVAAALAKSPAGAAQRLADIVIEATDTARRAAVHAKPSGEAP
jgi:UDP-N-acetylglucosamine--N-acetylmuramyl-(pentapeptide) pyrophosphoryl-undecaprenol N-acetylglucosamine transferase